MSLFNQAANNFNKNIASWIDSCRVHGKFRHRKFKNVAISYQNIGNLKNTAITMVTALLENIDVLLLLKLCGYLRME